jgi:hypothetical protein
MFSIRPIRKGYYKRWKVLPTTKDHTSLLCITVIQSVTLELDAGTNTLNRGGKLQHGVAKNSNAISSLDS